MLASIYITQYVALAFIMSAAFSILRKQGVELDKLSLLNLAATPLVFKILYAPVIDKYRGCFNGKYRSWLILAMTAMTALLIITSTLNLQTHFYWVVLVFTGYVLATGVQDVSVDGLSCKLFNHEQRKFASSVQFSGNLLGNIIGGGLLLIFYPWLQWQGSLLLLAGLTLISLLQIICFREPEDTTATAADSHRMKPGMWREIRTFVRQNRIWMLLLVFFPIGFSNGTAILNALLVDSGWALADIGFAIKVYGSVVGFLSALLATPLMTALGRANALLTITFIQACGLIFLVPVTLGSVDKLTVYMAITAYYLAFPAILVILATIIMDKAALTHNKATVFTLQFSLVSLMGFIYSALSMNLADHWGYSSVAIASVILTYAAALSAHCIFRRQSGASLSPASNTAGSDAERLIQHNP